MDYLQALKPGYFRGSRFFRYNDRLVVTNNHQLEYELFLIARLCIFHAWLRNVDVVCELGCGTCANLLLLSDTMPDAAFIGLDWARASCEIAGHLSKRLSRNISGHVFNMLEPDHGVDVPEGAAILSIHAFEQLGREFDAMLDFILAKRPAIVVQYEPVLEFYNTNSLLDALALRYCRKRGYLETTTRDCAICRIRSSSRSSGHGARILAACSMNRRLSYGGPVDPAHETDGGQRETHGHQENRPRRRSSGLLRIFRRPPRRIRGDVQ